MRLKKFLRFVIPKRVRYLLWRIIPKVYLINTYLLHRSNPINNLHPIDDKFVIKQVGWNDEQQLKKTHDFRGPDSYRNKVPPRLNAPEWIGLAVFDRTNGDIAYIAWVIIKSIKYFEEFGIHLKEGQFLLKDGFCIPDYRHQGLHTRMEQERINYCVRSGANEIFIQIHNDNKKGKESVLDNGYQLYRQNHVLQWSVFNIYRDLFSFLKNPIIKVLK